MSWPVSISQTAPQAEPPRPHLRHLQQGVQEQLQPAAAPVGAHGHQDEGPSGPGEGGRSEGRTGGEADGAALPSPPHPAPAAASSLFHGSRPRDPPPARSARQPGGPAGVCVNRPGNSNHGCAASAHPGSCCCCRVHGAGGFSGRRARVRPRLKDNSGLFDTSDSCRKCPKHRNMSAELHQL